jgi:hypothetical protein
MPILQRAALRFLPFGTSELLGQSSTGLIAGSSLRTKRPVLTAYRPKGQSVFEQESFSVLPCNYRRVPADIFVVLT